MNIMSNHHFISCYVFSERMELLVFKTDITTSKHVNVEEHGHYKKEELESHKV